MEKNNYQDNMSDPSIKVLKKQKEYLEQKLDSFNFSTVWFVGIAIGSILIGYALSSMIDYKKYETFSQLLERRSTSMIFTACLGIIFYGYLISIMRNSYQSKLRIIEYKLIQLDSEELQEKIDENFFTKLVKINFKYIDQYFLQTQEQANKSFRLVSSASITGLVILLIGVFMMFLEITKSAYVTTAAGVISQFIAAIFFYLYNKTVLKMSQYHQKLVITQNISLALKILEDYQDENKSKVQEMIIDRLTLNVNKYLSYAE